MPEEGGRNLWQGNMGEKLETFVFFTKTFFIPKKRFTFVLGGEDSEY